MEDEPEGVSAIGEGDPFLYEPASSLWNSQLEDVAQGGAMRSDGCALPACVTCFCGNGGCQCEVAIV